MLYLIGFSEKLWNIPRKFLTLSYHNLTSNTVLSLVYCKMVCVYDFFKWIFEPTKPDNSSYITKRSSLKTYLQVFKSSRLQLFFIKTLDPRPEKAYEPSSENCVSFSKNHPKKLFSNCLADGLLTSIV